ncbi:MAG: aminotransferase class V-fold PLP-dependent enzyme [Mariniphaga sp.]|nr:aminotransferase class V-fold PLP-dependent enzyme [Mariniphaga sp.]
MIPLYKPYMPAKLPELETILHSGNLAYGKWGRIFEEKLGEYIGNSNIAVVNSHTSAMLVTIMTLGLKSGDEIIASPMSCLASNQPFATQGIRVVWADIDPVVGTLAPDSVKSKISQKTKAIFHNHFCGYPGYINEINMIGKGKGIFVVDDAIEAFGSEYTGRKIGNTDSDATVFSFQAVRLPNTIDGGAIAFKDKALLEKAKQVRDYGIDRSLFRDNLREISPKCDISQPGYGATLSEINSYIGFLQMDEIDKLIQIQRNNAKEWNALIYREHSDFEPLKIQDYVNPSYWVYGLLSSDKIKMIKHFRKKGFYASSVHLPNSNYSVFGKNVYLPGVDEFYSKFLAIPSGWWNKLF